MRTIVELDTNLPVCPSFGALHQFDVMIETTNLLPHRNRSNSNSSEPISVSNDSISIPSSPSSMPLIFSSNTSLSETPVENIPEKQTNDINYWDEYDCPTDSEDESFYHNDHETNNDLFLEKHVASQQLNSIHRLQDEPYKRSKRSNKKINAQRQIKTKHAKSIRTNAHNKHLYIHHRLAKKVILDEPSHHYIPSPKPIPLYSSDLLRSIVYEYRQLYDASYMYYSRPPRNRHDSQLTNDLFIDESHTMMSSYKFCEYTLHANNIPDELPFDDATIHCLVEMQNRDLSPEDYEMLLRLDERIQRKTVNTSILNTLQTIDVDEMHLDDQCSICMENYQHGQQLKLLPCQHMFHVHCIETYLKEFSVQCPLDNLPLV